LFGICTIFCSFLNTSRPYLTMASPELPPQPDDDLMLPFSELRNEVTDSTLSESMSALKGNKVTLPDPSSKKSKKKKAAAAKREEGQSAQTTPRVLPASLSLPEGLEDALSAARVQRSQQTSVQPDPATPHDAGVADDNELMARMMNDPVLFVNEMSGRSQVLRVATSSLTARVDDLERTITQLRTTLTRLEAENSDLRSTMTILSDDKVRSETRLEDLKKDFANLLAVQDVDHKKRTDDLYMVYKDTPDIIERVTRRANDVIAMLPADVKTSLQQVTLTPNEAATLGVIKSKTTTAPIKLSKAARKMFK